MTVDADIFRRAGVDEARDDQARRAVTEGRKLLTTLTSYARNLTKDTSVQVVMATRDNGSTDGKKIFWRPPMALGDRTPHERRYCDRRATDTGLPLCPACATREDVLVVIYHEIAHIAFDSFAEVAESDKVELISKAIESTGGRYARAIEHRVKTAPYWTKKSYISMASLVSEFLPLIFNALEDARVNREMFKARKGTKQMFDANCAKIFTDGVEQIDPVTGKAKVIKWYDYPLNLQVIVGLFAKASGYNYSDWFRPNVVEALNDGKLGDLVNQLATTRTAAGVYHLGFPVLARLRELGFCQLPDDPEPELEPDGEDTGGDSDDVGDDESSESSPSSEGEDEDEGSDSEPGSESEGPSESDGGAGSSEEPDPAGSVGSSEENSEEPSDEAGGAGGDGSDSSSSPSDDGSDSGTGDDSSGADEEADSDADESGDPGSMGADDSTEEMGPTGDDDQGSDSDGAPGDPRDDSASGSDSNESEGDADSDEGESDGITGTGDIEGDRAPGEREREVAPDEGEDSSSGTGSGGSPSGDDAGLRGDGDSSDGPAQPDSEAGDETDDEPAAASGDDDGDSLDGEDSGDESKSAGDGSGEPTAEDEPIDTGADEGLGGTEVVENEANDDLPMGTPEEAKAGLLKLGDHEPPRKVYEEQLDEEAVDRAIVQGMYFETPSRNIFGVREHRYSQHVFVDGQDMTQAWEHSLYEHTGYSKHSLGIEGDFDPPESVLGPALLRMRVAFSDNKRAHDQPHLKAGRVNGRVLGKRAWADDERLFRRRIQPGKRDYFVLIGMDISGSTVGTNIQLEKRAVMAQAELCARMGITFAIYAHSGNFHSPRGGRSNGLDLDIYLVKEANEPWNGEVKQRLRDIGPDSANLDGHTLEYYRKVCDKRTETDKIIMYYTDGKMPAENHDEELTILQREIKMCRQRRYVLLGVGIRTDSPVRHGLDTVQVNDDADVAKVVRHLEKRLSVHV